MTRAPLRLRWFYRLAEAFGARARRRRMQQLARRIPLASGSTVLDLGGQPCIWGDAPGRLRVTILNLPGAEILPEAGAHEFRYVADDACAVRGVHAHEYDLVFSNSVIEHVGPEERQADFAREVRRLGRAYWVQTPAIWFPLEAHTGMPFWWFYPAALRERLLRRWRRRTPEWADSILDTRVLTRSRMQALFPEARIHVERVLGIPKSYAAWYAPRPLRRRRPAG